MSDTVVLSTYPVSAGFRAAIEARYGAGAEYLLLPELRRLPPSRLAGTLWRLRPSHFVLAQEDEESAAVLPVLHLVAAATRSRRLEVLGPDLVPRRRTRLGAAGAALGLLRGTAEGGVALWRTRRETARLLAEAPRGYPPVRQGPVLYLNTNLWFGIKAGGSVGHIAGVVNGFQRLGWPVTYASISGSQMLDPEVVIRPLGAPGVYGFPSEVNHYRFHAAALRQLAPLIRAVQPSLLYQRMSVGNYTGVALSRRFGVPLVLEYNGGSSWMSRNWGRGMRFEALATAAEDTCLRHAHRVLTVSEVLADEVVRRGVPRERVLWYPNCVDERIFDPDRFPAAQRAAYRARVGLAPEDRVITFVGTFGRWHGVEVLAQAAARLVLEDRVWLERHRVRFLLIGDGVTMPEVRRQLAAPGCDRYVRLSGLVPQNEAPGFLAASDILASPHVPNPDGSRFFGSPTKLFEYMAMDRPIVASRLDQVGEVLSPGLDGARLPDSAPAGDARAVLVEPASVDELMGALRFLVERPDWCAHLAANARRIAGERYLWRHHVEHLLDGLPLAGTR